MRKTLASSMLACGYVAFARTKAANHPPTTSPAVSDRPEDPDQTGDDEPLDDAQAPEVLPDREQVEVELMPVEVDVVFKGLKATSSWCGPSASRVAGPADRNSGR